MDGAQSPDSESTKELAASTTGIQVENMINDDSDHDVPSLSPEVAGVPVPAHGPGVRPGEDQLVTGSAPRLHLLCVMSLTEHLVLVHAVGQVH